jgi:hypothetical protein
MNTPDPIEAPAAGPPVETPLNPETEKIKARFVRMSTESATVKSAVSATLSEVVADWLIGQNKLQKGGQRGGTSYTSPHLFKHIVDAPFRGAGLGDPLATRAETITGSCNSSLQRAWKRSQLETAHRGFNVIQP